MNGTQHVIRRFIGLKKFRLVVMLVFFFQFHLSLTAYDLLEGLFDTGKSTIKTECDLPRDITFFFADIKYTGSELKICEFGGMFTGGEHTHHIFNGPQKKVSFSYWDLFWHYLSRFNKPIWYIGEKKEAVMKTLTKVGGIAFSSSDEFLDYYSKQNFSKPTSSALFTGILVDKQRALKRRSFLKTYPEIILVNAYTKKFAGKRNPIIELITHNPELSELIPCWKMYEKKYTPTLALRITQEIPADFYIIKPVRGIMSKGVLMVSRKDLDSHLKLILQETEAIKPTDFSHLAYWKTDQNESFFVQAYAPSKEITYERKRYDPTMRVIFFLSHDQGVVTVDVAAGFWKIPPQSLDAQAPLTEKHITRPFIGRFFSGIPIDPVDFKHVQKLLNSTLPSVYCKMLEYATQH